MHKLAQGPTPVLAPAALDFVEGGRRALTKTGTNVKTHACVPSRAHVPAIAELIYEEEPSVLSAYRALVAAGGHVAPASPLVDAFLRSQPSAHTPRPWLPVSAPRGDSDSEDSEASTPPEPRARARTLDMPPAAAAPTADARAQTPPRPPGTPVAVVDAAWVEPSGRERAGTWPRRAAAARSEEPPVGGGRWALARFCDALLRLQAGRPLLGDGDSSFGSDASDWADTRAGVDAGDSEDDEEDLEDEEEEAAAASHDASQSGHAVRMLRALEARGVVTDAQSHFLRSLVSRFRRLRRGLQ